MDRLPRFRAIEDVETWLDEVAGDRLNRRRAFAGGNLVALYDDAAQAIEDAGDGNGDRPVRLARWVWDGLSIAAKDSQAIHAGHEASVMVPTSVVEGLLAGLETAMMAGPIKTGRRGRPPMRAWDAKRWRRDMIDWVRFRQVKYRLVARRADSPEHPSKGEQRDQRRQYQQLRGGVDMWTPYLWSVDRRDEDESDWSVFQAVARIYDGTIYKGSKDEIKKSWERVNVALKAGEAWRYYPSKFVRYDERQLLTADADLAR